MHFWSDEQFLQLTKIFFVSVFLNTALQVGVKEPFFANIGKILTSSSF
jgi:hypothetical protein